MALEVKEEDALDTAKREWLKKQMELMGLSAGGNKAVAAQAGAASGAVGSPVASAGPQQVKKIDFTNDEARLEGASLIQIFLGNVKWGGKHRGVIWALPDQDGVAAQSGPTWQRKELGAMNGLGKWVVNVINNMDAFDQNWRKAYSEVRKSTDQGSADLKSLEKAGPAISDRMAKDRNVFRDVNDYLAAMDKVGEIARDIPRAQKTFEAALAKLDAEVFAFNLNELSDQFKDKEDQVKQLKADIENAQAMFKNVMELATSAAKQDWIGAASKVISMVGKELIDMSYEPKMLKLTNELQRLKNQMTEIRIDMYRKRVEEARAALEAAAIALDNKQAELQNKAGEASRLQFNSNNALESSPSTAVAAKVIKERTNQELLLANAKEVCKNYIEGATTMSDSLDKVAKEYSKIGDWLKKAAQSDGLYDVQHKYARMLELSGRQNVVKINEWQTWVQHNRDNDCKPAQQWLEQSKGGPMEPFEKGMTTLKQAMGQRPK